MAPIRMTTSTIKVLEVLMDADSGDDMSVYGLDVVRKSSLGTGTVYPILSRLERIGWIRSHWDDSDTPGARRKFYALTGEGRAGIKEAFAARPGLVARRFAT
ncbi:PadR family transcriptional regulator [Actinomadura macrotermitis]|uniref:Transcription regulator PadR N-terminal domain-containing protein n=1 Tax=Actinomadura macrotermitis TaxID=2585200 RepID=A0A7K0BSZ0_9ACTN|nr:PadR family transcriptional regulator [Actinomadura macrotermitis]MQY04156.1 hypothetical protein [Actinomadura macrotermitis]